MEGTDPPFVLGEIFFLRYTLYNENRVHFSRCIL